MKALGADQKVHCNEGYRSCHNETTQRGKSIQTYWSLFWISSRHNDFNTRQTVWRITYNKSTNVKKGYTEFSCHIFAICNQRGIRCRITMLFYWLWWWGLKGLAHPCRLNPHRDDANVLITLKTAVTNMKWHSILSFLAAIKYILHAWCFS